MASFVFTKSTTCSWVSCGIEPGLQADAACSRLFVSQLNSGDSWRLLHAGADEVLSWNAKAAWAGQIKARIERWTAIDDLAESPLVRESLLGESLVWRSLVRRIVEAARFTQSPVLLIGESGTGKEMLAWLVQRLDERGLERRVPQPYLKTPGLYNPQSGTGRERVVRTPARRVYRSGEPTGGSVRPCRWRHSFSIRSESSRCAFRLNCFAPFRRKPTNASEVMFGRLPISVLSAPPTGT